jgi:hypothetical protein
LHELVFGNEFGREEFTPASMAVLRFTTAKGEEAAKLACFTRVVNGLHCIGCSAARCMRCKKKVIKIK